LIESDKEKQAERTVGPINAFFKTAAGTVKTFSPHHQKICKSRIFAIVSVVEMTYLLQDTKSTHSSKYFSGSLEKPETQ
jgi:hypothetical protein